MNYRIALGRAFIMLCMTIALNVDATTNADIDTLTPITQGGSTTIAPGTHMQGKATVTGPTMQSAANLGSQYLLGNTLKGRREIGSSVMIVKAGSGMAVLVIGSSIYGTYANTTATLISKRMAYMRAYAKAMTNLIAYFKKTGLGCEEQRNEHSESFSTGTGNAANLAASDMEGCMKRVSGLLRGFDIFSVKDDVKHDTAVVIIASSPKTRGALDRLGPAVMKTDNMHYAWKSVLAQLETGVIPPMGARLIVNPTTHQRYVIGFGSAIVAENSDPFMEHHLEQFAGERAKMQAQAALIGFLRGDASYWKGGYTENVSEGNSQFDPSSVRAFRSNTDKLANIGRELAGVVAHIQKGDFSGAITAASNDIDHHPNANSIPTYQNTRNSFLQTLKQTSAGRRVERGMVPPGVTNKTFLDNSGHWAIAISIYSPAVTKRVENSYKQHQPTPNAAAGSSAPSRRIPTSGGMSPTAPNPKGPSGQVTPLGDL